MAGFGRATAVLIAVALSLTACTAASAPPDAWRLLPLEFNGASDGEPPRRTDVSYAMRSVTDDTAGGFWSESAGSWLHIGADGETISRFNLDEYDARVIAIAALTPDVLVVSRGDATTDGIPQLFTFGAPNREWTALQSHANWVGDVAANSAGTIVFVDFPHRLYLHDAPELFTVQALDPNGTQRTVLGADAGLTASSIAIDLDDHGNVYVATESELFVVRTNGSVEELGRLSGAPALVEVSDDGAVLTRDLSGAADVAVWVEQGSEDARRAIGMGQFETLPVLTVLDGTGSIRFPDTGNALAAVWLDESSFMYVAHGSGDEAALVRVSPPE